MKELQGTYGKDCKVFTDNIEPQALETIQKLLDNPVTEGKPVRIMPDTHDGKGIVIGFTMPVGEWVNPNHIGVDIGCGMLCARITSTITPDMYMDIDQRIREVVPMGFDVHYNPKTELIGKSMYDISLQWPESRTTLSPHNLLGLCGKLDMRLNILYNSIGTLRGGNHFIELGRSEKTGHYYLTIHSGSRNFGKRVCDYHAKNLDGYKNMLAEEVEHIKQTRPKQQWEAAIKLAKKRLQGREGYLTGKAKEEYLKDMYTAQAYASVNRYTMLPVVTEMFQPMARQQAVFLFLVATLNHLIPLGFEWKMNGAEYTATEHSVICAGGKDVLVRFTDGKAYLSASGTLIDFHSSFLS